MAEKPDVVADALKNVISLMETKSAAKKFKDLDESEDKGKNKEKKRKRPKALAALVKEDDD